MKKVNVKVGDTLWLTLPHSEVCMHMGVAGRRMAVQVKEHGAQLLSATGQHNFSAPITHGEAGIYTNADGTLYTYVQDCAYPGDHEHDHEMCVDVMAELDEDA